MLFFIERQRKRDKFGIPLNCFILQMHAIVRARPCQSQLPGIQCRPPTWVAGTQLLGLYSAVSQCVHEQEDGIHTGVGTQAQALRSGSGFLKRCLNFYTKCSTSFSFCLLTWFLEINRSCKILIIKRYYKKFLENSKVVRQISLQKP